MCGGEDKVMANSRRGFELAAMVWRIGSILFEAIL